MSDDVSYKYAGLMPIFVACGLFFYLTFKILQAIGFDVNTGLVSWFPLIGGLFFLGFAILMLKLG